MAETTYISHQQMMADLRREAVDLLQRQAQDHASDTQRIHQEATTNAENKANYAYSTRIQQLELALELKGNERVQLLAQKDAERDELLARSWAAQRTPFAQFTRECKLPRSLLRREYQVSTRRTCIPEG